MHMFCLMFLFTIGAFLQFVLWLFVGMENAFMGLLEMAPHRVTIMRASVMMASSISGINQMDIVSTNVKNAIFSFIRDSNK